MSKIVSNLTPNVFFVTKGSGESDLELHAGSYHMALYDAGISDYNIMVYSSILPKTARLVTMDEIDFSFWLGDEDDHVCLSWDSGRVCISWYRVRMDVCRGILRKWWLGVW